MSGLFSGNQKKKEFFLRLKNETLVELVSGAFFMLYPSSKNTGALGFQSIKIFGELQKITCPDYILEAFVHILCLFSYTIHITNDCESKDLMLQRSKATCFRSMFQGMTIPKEVSPYHLRSLNMAIDIREGTIPELLLHQKKVQKMPEAQRCNIIKFVRPTVNGFQCLHHCVRADTKITELCESGNPFDEKNSDSVDIEKIAKTELDSSSFASCTVRNEQVDRISDALTVKGASAIHMRQPIDSFAICTQRIAFPSKYIPAILSAEKSSQILTCNWKLHKQSLRAPKSTGNRHEVVLRRIPTKQQGFIGDALDCVEKSGFLNYFPHTAFSGRMRNGIIFGAHLLHGEFRAIVNLLIDTGDPKVTVVDGEDTHGNPHTKKSGIAAHRSVQQNAITTTEFTTVNASLRSLLKNTDFDDEPSLADVDEAHAQSVIKKSISKATLSHWMNEMCCMIWNRAVSCRVACFGAFCVLPGDIVQRNGKYVFISEEDIAAKRVSYSDVLMPIPGSDVSLPQNECALMYERIFDEFRLPHEMDKWTSGVLDNPIRGAYRNMIIRPTNVKHEILPKGSDMSLKLTFDLPNQCFGSMLIRELCKHDLNTPKDASIDMHIGLKTAEATQSADKRSGKGRPSNDDAVLGIKPRNRSEQEKQLYSTKFSPDRKKYTSGKSLHQVRLMNVIYREVFPPGRDRMRKLRVNGRL